MEVKRLWTLPSNLTSSPKTYETKYLYTGFGKYDTHRNMIVLTEGLPNGMLRIHEEVYKPHAISRVYHTELVRVDIYQESPRIWSETLSPYEVYYFQQQ